MTRLQRLVKVVQEEQAVVRAGGTKADTEELCRHQDRLLTYIARNNKTAPSPLTDVGVGTREASQRTLNYHVQSIQFAYCLG